MAHTPKPRRRIAKLLHYMNRLLTTHGITPPETLTQHTTHGIAATTRQPHLATVLNITARLRLPDNPTHWRPGGTWHVWWTPDSDVFPLATMPPNTRLPDTAHIFYTPPPETPHPVSSPP